jgi:hypothetical protein
MPRLLPAVLLALPLFAACDDTTLAPGLESPGCEMSFTPLRITRVDLPDNASEAFQMGLDLDDKPGDGVDNMLGQLVAAIHALSPDWDVEAAMDARLAEGGVHWVMEVGRCTDGGDEVRVQLGRGADVDGDGRLEIVDHGVAAVGTAGEHVVTARGVGLVPVGALTDGDGAFATAAWIPGFALATDLAPAGGGAFEGRLALGVGDFTDDGLRPLLPRADASLTEDTAAASFWRDRDTDRNGAIDVAEMRAALDAIAPRDLDLGACDAPSCYRPDGDDGTADHRSLGLVVRAEPVELE